MNALLCCRPCQLIAPVALVLLLVVPRAQAEVVQWLYQVAVPVSDQSPAARTDAGQAALEEVLVRVSGVAPLPQSRELADALRRPERYYSQFRYLAPTADQPELKARFDFAPAVVLDLAKSLALPVWWANRPRVVPWVLIRDGSERVVIEDAAAPFAAALMDRARQRGVPVALPQADETGLAPVPPQLLARGDRAVLTSASVPYDAEALGLVQVTRRGGRYVARGSLLLADEAEAAADAATTAPGPQELSFQVAAVDLAGLGAATADAMAEQLAARFAASGGGGVLAVRLHDVTNPTDYATVMAYLRGLEFVDRVALQALAGQVLELAIASQADARRFVSLLSVDGVLGEQPPAAAGTGLATPLPPELGGAIALRYLGAADP
ncbi:MAG: DUF2066 domain-containing protein [Pseudomonadota bacterium]